MSCKYDIIEEGGRKRVRALRHFTVQGRDVCPMELGGYVYDANTLSQDGNCWIFSGSLEYPGVRVMDEAIVDMGNNLPKSTARPKSVIISGNSRIMGAISFETQSAENVQVPAMFEQGGYTANAGVIPVKVSDGACIRTPSRLFGGTIGRVTITNPLYQARVVFIGENGLVTGTSGEWTTGGTDVTITVGPSYFLVEVRKTAVTAITPADVTSAGVSIRGALETQINVFNSSIVPVYNGSVANSNNVFRLSVSGTRGEPTTTNVRNSYLRVECVYNDTNTLVINADFTKVNYNLVSTAGIYTYVSGVFRNTNMNSPASVPGEIYVKRLHDVSDCPNFEYSTVTFPDLTAMIASGKTFYFKNCNMPAGSAIHYYDPKVNVWDNIDFTKAMADLGKTAFANTTIVSSNVQGMYRARGNTSGVMGGLLEAASSFDGATYSGVPGATYDSIIYKDCVIKGIFTIIGRNVFGGTLGGASKITNTTEKAMVIDGNFRIEGNAQVTDTPLKGTGYIGGNAELKNGNVGGYIYMSDNAKYIPEAVANPGIIKHVIMTGNSQVLKQRDVSNNFVNLELSDNAVIDSVAGTDRGLLKMSGNAYTFLASTTTVTPLVYGTLEMKEDAKQVGGTIATHGDITLTGKYNQTTGAPSIYGKRVISDTSQIAVVDVPPTKTTW